MKYTLLFLVAFFLGAVQAQVALSATGGQLTNGVAISFANAVDGIPGAVNTGAITLGFTTATALPIGKKITIALPAGYFSAADSSKANTFKTGGAASTATASCAITDGVVGTKVLGTDGAAALICTTATAVLAAGAQVLTLIAGAVTTGAEPVAASTFNVATSGDRQLATAPATVALGGQLTNGVAISFAVASNTAPGTLSTDAITLGFTTATALPIGRTITIALPAGYFSAAAASKVNTFKTGGAASTATASCTLTAGVSGTKVLGIDGADSLICTTAAAVLAAGAQVLTLIAGAVTTGTPQAASTFNVATSVDRQLSTAPATVALGGQLTAGSALEFSLPADYVPGAIASTGTVKIKFTTATAIPVVGGKITIALPKGYLTAADDTKENTFTTDGSASPAKVKCTWNAGTSGTAVLGISDAQTLTCLMVDPSGILSPGAQVLTLLVGAVTAGASPQAIASYNVATSADRQLATAPATVALGGRLTAGAALVFSAAADKAPTGIVTTGTIKIGFTTATAIPVGGKITIALPAGYFSALANPATTDTVKTTGGGQTTTASCALTAGVATTAVLGIMGADKLICTTAVAALAAGVQEYTLIVGAVKIGTPQAAAKYNIATTQDLELATAPATVALGGRLTAGAALVFSAAADKAPTGAVTTGTIKIGFTTATAIPVGGKITIALPAGYISSAAATTDTVKTTGGGQTTTASCVYAAGAATTAVLGIMGADKLTCTTAVAALAAGVQEYTLILGAVTIGTPQAAAKYNVATSGDLELATAPATVALGGRLTAGTALVFSTSEDRAEGTLNTGVVKIGFTTATAIPVSGKITIALPAGYFSAGDANKVNTVKTTGGGQTTTATCVYAAGASTTAVLGIMGADKLTCTTAVAALAAGVQEISLIAGAVTTGSPQAASTYQVATSQDMQLSAAASLPINYRGGTISNVVEFKFSTGSDIMEDTLNTGAITVGFKTSAALIVSNKITLALPSNYFTAVDNSKIVTFDTTVSTPTTSAISAATATCAYTAGSSVVAVLGVMGGDKIVCTVATATLAAGTQVMTFIAGSVTVGPPQAAGTINLGTSSDIQVPAPAVATGTTPQKTLYLPKASGSFHGVALFLVALSTLLVFL